MPSSNSVHFQCTMSLLTSSGLTVHSDVQLYSMTSLVGVVAGANMTTFLSNPAVQFLLNMQGFIAWLVTSG